MVGYLISSLIASIAITGVLNLMIQAFPGTSADARARQLLGESVGRRDEMPSPDQGKQLRLYFPWRQMLWWSAGLTVLANMVRLLA